MGALDKHTEEVSVGAVNREGSTRHGDKWLRIALVEAAHAAGRSKNTSLAAHYHRIRGQRGPWRAAVAVGHSILVIVWHLLANPNARFHDLGSDFYTSRIDKTRRTRHLVRQLEALGHTVPLGAPPMAA